MKIRFASKINDSLSCDDPIDLSGKEAEETDKGEGVEKQDCSQGRATISLERREQHARRNFRWCREKFRPFSNGMQLIIDRDEESQILLNARMAVKEKTRSAPRRRVAKF